MAGDERVLAARGRAVPRIGLGTWRLPALREEVERERWTAIPRSSSRERRAEGLDVFSFAPSGEERARLEGVAA